MPHAHTSQRLYGLDSLRSLAIIIVLIYHYKVVVSREPLFGFMSQLGWAGVDLFFVLSGYLIGNQVLGAIARNQDFSLKLFYIRRLFRTLPNYYVVLALYLLFPVALAGTETAPFWSFLTFTQNLSMRPGETFTHSWSLCIEEQFYLLFPIVALLVLKWRQSPVSGWMILVGCTLGAIALRVYMLNSHGGVSINILDYYEHIYYPSFTRFDELLPGIAIALVKNFHREMFQTLMQHGQKIMLAGVAVTGITLYGFKVYWFQSGVGVNYFWASCGYSLLAWGFALLVLSALSPRSWLYRVRIPGAASIALWSYAVYLIHKPLFQLLKSPLTAARISVDGYLGMSIIMAVSLAGGWLLFRFVESPFMNWRSRAFPSNVRIPALAASAAQS